MPGKALWRCVIGLALLLNLAACSLTPPAEFQAYDGERLAHSDHAIVLNNGGAFVVQVDDKRTGGLSQGGYAETVFMLPGLRRIYLVTQGYGASADSVIVCVDVEAGGVYSAMATLLPDEQLYHAELWLRDNQSGVGVGTAVGLTESCQ